ncbi:MAG: hypothetical protein ACC641_10355 [Acidiferrobacterales bacterium]
MSDSNDKLIGQSRRVLDERIDELDDNVIARLRAARLRATDIATRKNERPAWIKPVGGLVAATLVVGVATSLWMTNPSVPKYSIEDMDILASAESPEFYQDLEFYLWLEERSRAG